MVGSGLTLAGWLAGWLGVPSGLIEDPYPPQPPSCACVRVFLWMFAPSALMGSPFQRGVLQWGVERRLSGKYGDNSTASILTCGCAGHGKYVVRVCLWL